MSAPGIVGEIPLNVGSTSEDWERATDLHCEINDGTAGNPQKSLGGEWLINLAGRDYLVWYTLSGLFFNKNLLLHRIIKYKKNTIATATKMPHKIFPLLKQPA